MQSTNETGLVIVQLELHLGQSKILSRDKILNGNRSNHFFQA